MLTSLANHILLTLAALATVGVDAAQKTKQLTACKLIISTYMNSVDVGSAPAAQSLLDWSNHVNDLRFDNSYKYVAYADLGAWSVRFTAWYTAGLLYRNEGDDMTNAKAAIENM